MFTKLVLIFILFLSVNAFLDAELVISFLNKNSLRYCTILTCYDKKHEVNLAKQLTAEISFAFSILNLKYVNILNAVYNKYKRIGVLLDGDCENAHKLLQKCGRYKCFDGKHFWLITHSTKNYTYLFDNVNINIDSNIKVAYPKDLKTPTEGYIIQDVFNPAAQRGGELKISQVGSFDKERGYDVNENEGKFFARRNLTGVTFRTLVVLPQRYTGTLTDHLQSDQHKDINNFNRFHSRLLHYCRDYYNFSMTIKSDISWGFLKSDGTMDGLVGELERRSVDFGLSPLLVKPDRAKVIVYGRKTWELRTAFIFRIPKSRKSYQIFIKPLSHVVWACVIACAILSIVIQKVSSTLDCKITRQADYSWGQMTVSTLGAFCQQGTSSNLLSLCGKLTIYVTLLLGALIYQFYSASLVSFLLNVPTTQIIDTKQLMEHNFKLGCADSLYFKDFLKVSTDNVIKEVYRRLLIPQGNQTGFLQPKEGLDLVKKGKYAFHVELATGYPIIQKNYDEMTICDLKEVPMFGSRGMYANYQKQSPFKDIMDVCLHRFAENGILTREKHFWHPPKPECVRSAATINISTGLADFYPALVILLFGIIISLQILVVELFCNYRDNMVTDLKKQKTIYPYLD